MFFERCSSPKAMREEIKEFRKDPEEFAAGYNITRFSWAMGSLHEYDRPYEALAKRVYQDARIRANDLWEKDERLPQPEITVTDPETGLDLIVQWCIKATRATEQPAKTRDKRRASLAGSKTDKRKKQPVDDTDQGTHPVTLEQFMREYCDIQGYSDGVLESRKTCLFKASNRGAIKLPDHVGKWNKGKPKYFRPHTLIERWPSYRKQFPNLPPLKPDSKSKEERAE